MLSVGFDIGLDSIAVATARESGEITVSTVMRSYFVKDSERAFDSLYFGALASLAAMVKREKFYRVLIEQSYGALNLRTFKSLSHVEAEIRYEFARQGIVTEFVGPSAWQSYFLGKTKPRDLLEKLSLKEARAIYAHCVTVHEADAIHIARFGLLRNNEDTKCRKKAPNRKSSRT